MLWAPALRLAFLCLIPATAPAASPTLPEKLIEAGHWKRARVLVEARLKQDPQDALANFLLSQIRAAFGDRNSPLPLAEKAEALDPATARYHRQVAEVLGVAAQHANVFQQLLLARRFRKEIDAALALDPHDIQALRDLIEFYLLAPAVAGGDGRKAETTAARIAAIDSAAGFLAQARIAEFHRDKSAEESLLRRAVEAAPADYGARIALARLTQNEAEARAALALDPGRVDAYCILASMDAGRGDWQALDAILAAAARAVPDDAAPFYRAAEALRATGSGPARAEGYLRIYLEQPPEGNEPSAAEARAELSRCEKSR